MKFQDFMDLCSVSNISILIMDEDFHGYYIHGKAPWQQSDLTLAELKAKLDSEQQGKEQSRGLQRQLASGSIFDIGQVQTYEIYLPASLREDINAVYKQRLSITKMQEKISQEKQREEKQRKKQQKMDEDKSNGGAYSNIPNRDAESNANPKAKADKQTVSINI